MRWFDWLGVVAGVLAVGGFFWDQVRRAHNLGTTLMGKWIGRHVAPLVAHQVSHELEPLKQEFRPNGGNSTSDKLSRVDERTLDMKRDIREMRREFTAHLEHHARMD